MCPPQGPSASRVECRAHRSDCGVRGNTDLCTAVPLRGPPRVPARFPCRASLRRASPGASAQSCSPERASSSKTHSDWRGLFRLPLPNPHTPGVGSPVSRAARSRNCVACARGVDRRGVCLRAAQRGEGFPRAARQDCGRRGAVCRGTAALSAFRARAHWRCHQGRGRHSRPLLSGLSGRSVRGRWLPLVPGFRGMDAPPSSWRDHAQQAKGPLQTRGLKHVRCGGWASADPVPAGSLLAVGGDGRAPSPSLLRPGRCPFSGKHASSQEEPASGRHRLGVRAVVATGGRRRWLVQGDGGHAAPPRADPGPPVVSPVYTCGSFPPCGGPSRERRGLPKRGSLPRSSLPPRRGAAASERWCRGRAALSSLALFRPPVPAGAVSARPATEPLCPAPSASSAPAPSLGRSRAWPSCPHSGRGGRRGLSALGHRAVVSASRTPRLSLSTSDTWLPWGSQRDRLPRLPPEGRRGFERVWRPTAQSGALAGRHCSDGNDSSQHSYSCPLGMSLNYTFFFFFCQISQK